MTKIFLTASLLALSTVAVTAQTMVEDQNGDGVFSMDELKAAYPDLSEDLFASIDANADGVVDADEMTAAIGAGLLAG